MDKWMMNRPIMKWILTDSNMYVCSIVLFVSLLLYQSAIPYLNLISYLQIAQPYRVHSLHFRSKSHALDSVICDTAKWIWKEYVVFKKKRMRQIVMKLTFDWKFGSKSCVGKTKLNSLRNSVKRVEFEISDQINERHSCKRRKMFSDN